MTRKRRGRSVGSVYKRKDNTWCASISFGHGADGRPIRKVAYGSNKQEALSKLKDLQARAGTNTDAGAMTVGQLLARWL